MARRACSSGKHGRRWYRRSSSEQVRRSDKAAAAREGRDLTLGIGEALLDELNESGIRTKTTVMKTGQSRAGIPFARGTLLHLLGNRVYRCETRHCDIYYPGEQEPIVPARLWDGVQEQRAGNRVARSSDRNVAHPSLLVGLVFDGFGRRMTPNPACKGPRRYRYFLTAPEAVTVDQPAWRLPAQDFETLVMRQVMQLLGNAAALQEVISDVVVLDGPDWSAYSRT